MSTVAEANVTVVNDDGLPEIDEAYRRTLAGLCR
jgi:hypothetical protein